MDAKGRGLLMKTIIKKHYFTDERVWYDFQKSLGYKWCVETKYLTQILVQKGRE